MMYKNTRKLLALLLALMMCFSLLPLQAFAGEPEDELPEEPEETHVCVYDAVVTEPGCTEGGYTTYSCPVCGDWYVDDYTDALGHTPEEGVCTVCGESIEGGEEFEALPEEPDGTVSAQNADRIEIRNPGDVEINEENFPDDNFRAYVRESIAGGGDVLTPEQIEGQDNLPVSGKEIRSLQGVGIFTKLVTLDCSDNELTELDLSGNPMLKELDCSDNSLSTLDLSGCTALVSLSCSGNKLSTLDVSGNPMLRELECRDNSSLSALDADGCSSLSSLDCSTCSLSTLDLGGCESLMWLYCQNNSLSALDVSDCAALEELYCYNNSLSLLTLAAEDNDSVSGCTDLEMLYCYGNSLNALDLSGTALKDTVENGSAELGEIDGKSVIVFFRENGVLYVDAALARKGLNPLGLLPDSLALDRSYVLLKLKEGEKKGSVQLAVDGLDGQWTGYLLWTVSADGTPDGPATDVISVDENGKVSAEKAGTAYVVACLRKNGLERVAVCRVDVAENEPADEITGVRLVDTKATVELYKTDYARVTVIPELIQNQLPSADAFTIPDEVPPDTPLENGGVAVESAEFADEETDRHFLLHVADDRTLEIIPRAEFVTTDAATLRQLKGSYTSAIKVMVAGRTKPFETAQKLTLTVKKSAPKVTVKVDKLNSFIPGDTKPLIFTGTAVKAAVPDPDKETLQPGWLTYDEEAFTVTLNEDALDMRKSDKLYLLVQPEGWNVLMPVTVPVSAAQTMPKLSARPASVSLHPDADDAAFVDVMKTPTHFAGIAGWPVEAISVTESGKDASGALHILGEYGGVYFHLRPGAKAPTDGKAHTYKVTLALMRRNSDGSLTASPARTTLTVKLLAGSTKLTLSAKAAGSIDTAIPGSYATVTVTPKGVNPEFVHLDTTNWSELSVERQKGREEAETVTDDFEFSADYGELLSFRVKPVAELEKGCTYTLKIKKTIGGRELECSVKLPVKFSAKTPATAVSLKAAGALDPIRA